MNTRMRTRYEIEVTRLKSGRLCLTMYDEYWDKIDHAFLGTGFKSPALEGAAWAHKAFAEVGKELANVQAGKWYALRTPSDDYPFGTPTELVAIPGRHMIYVQL